MSIARARVPAGGTTRWHHLEDTVERYLILEGEGLLETGAGRSSMEPGSVAVIAAGEAQRITNTGKGDLVFLALCTPRFERENYVNLET